MKRPGTQRRFSSRAFTLIELMIVVAIIGILASIAIPKFADLLNKSKEGATKGSLGALRSTLSIYYGDMEGFYPSDTLTSLTVNGKYLTAIPFAKTPPYHADTSGTNGGLASDVSINEVGGWMYDNEITDANFGTILVSCTHTDTKGTIWSSY
jgi:prepilin-type N-terminal cleavage/methylation domain-containing protein